MTYRRSPGVRRVEHVMGMPIVVDLRDEDADEDTLDYVFGWFRWVDATFSTYKETVRSAALARGELDVGGRARRTCARS